LQREAILHILMSCHDPRKGRSPWAEMDIHCSATELVQRHCQGDPNAAGELFAYYAERLSRLAERHLSR